MTGRPETSQTLDRGLRVLEVLAASPDGLSIAELARATQLGRTVLYRLVATLEARGYVMRGAEGSCRLGLAVAGLSAGVMPTLRRAALPVLQRLSRVADTTATLSVLDGEDWLVVEAVEPVGTGWYVGARAGDRWPRARPSPAGFEVVAMVPEVAGIDLVVAARSLVEPNQELVVPSVREAARILARTLRGT